MERLVIAGSGKMGRDIGLYFLKKGHPVTWLSRDPERLEALRERLARPIERIIRNRPERRGAPQAGFHLYDDADLPAPDLVIECVNEEREDKREVFSRLEQPAGPQALFLSASSSILPGEIHPRCLGAHFFYPVELTGLAELVLTKACPPGDRGRTMAFLGRAGVRVIEQTEETAFAANRLLLPLQAEVFRALRSGRPAEEVEAASRSSLFPLGQLSFMDAVGLEVIRAAVQNYIGRMPEERAAEYAPLPAGLGELLALGKRGRKNGDGLLIGAPLPWKAPAAPLMDRGDMSRAYSCLLLNTCYRFFESGLVDEPGLGLMMTHLFQAEALPDEVLRREGSAKIKERLEALHRETGLSYFLPAGALL